MNRRSHARLAAVLAVFVLLLTACGNSGAPEGYAEQPNDEGVPIIEANFLDACVVAGQQQLDLVQQGLETVCQCSYDQLSSTLSFDEFTKLDEDLRDNLDAVVPEDVLTTIRNCILANNPSS